MIDRSKVVFFCLCLIGALAFKADAQQPPSTTVSSSAEGNGIRQEIKSLRQQEGQLRTQIKALRDQADPLYNQIKALEAQIKPLREQIKQIQAQCHPLQEQQRAIQKKIDIDERRLHHLHENH